MSISIRAIEVIITKISLKLDSIIIGAKIMIITTIAITKKQTARIIVVIGCLIAVIKAIAERVIVEVVCLRLIKLSIQQLFRIWFPHFLLNSQI